MSLRILKTGDLDLDLQGEIGLETQKFCVIPCECNNFWNFIFKLDLCIDHQKALDYSKNLRP